MRSSPIRRTSENATFPPASGKARPASTASRATGPSIRPSASTRRMRSAWVRGGPQSTRRGRQRPAGDRYRGTAALRCRFVDDFLDNRLAAEHLTDLLTGQRLVLQQPAGQTVQLFEVVGQGLL